MGDRVRVVHDGDGRLVAAKSPPPDDPGRTRREANILAGIHHPGVADLIEVRDTEAGPEVVTRWVGSRTVADLPRPLDPARAAGLVLAVASTLGDLHRLGVVHGGLDATHVLLDPRGRPVLCGFGRARRLDDPEPDINGLGEPRPSTDVAGLGGLLLDLLSDGDVTIPDRHWALPPSRAARRGSGQRKALERIARQAMAEDPTCRPGVRAVADAIQATVPDATLAPHAPPTGTQGAPVPRDLVHELSRLGADDRRPPPLSTDPLAALLAEVDDSSSTSIAGRSSPSIDAPRVTDHPPRRDVDDGLDRPRASELDEAATSRPRLARWGGASLVVGLGLLGFLGASIVTRTSPPPATPSTLTPADQTTPLRPAGPTPAASAPGSLPAGPTAPGAAPVDAAGVSVELEHRGMRYRVGQPGDLVTIGDWRCTGEPIPALYRPSTGSVFVFPAWPAPGGRSDIAPVLTSPGGESLVAGPSGDGGCPTLVLRHDDGHSTVIDKAMF